MQKYSAIAMPPRDLAALSNRSRDTSATADLSGGPAQRCAHAEAGGIDTFVALNVSGKAFDVERSLFTRPEAGMLAPLVLGALPSARDPTGRIFLGADPGAFRYILFFLRHHKTPAKLPRGERDILEVEADYLGLAPLALSLRIERLRDMEPQGGAARLCLADALFDAGAEDEAWDLHARAWAEAASPADAAAIDQHYRQATAEAPDCLWRRLHANDPIDTLPDASLGAPAGSALFHVLRGRYYLDFDRRPEQAAQEAQRALEIRPDLVEALVLGHDASVRSLTPTAPLISMTFFEQALALSPYYWPAWHADAKAWVEHRLGAGAAADARTTERHCLSQLQEAFYLSHRRSALILSTLGHLLTKAAPSGDSDDGRKIFAQAQALDPGLAARLGDPCCSFDVEQAQLSGTRRAPAGGVFFDRLTTAWQLGPKRAAYAAALGRLCLQTDSREACLWAARAVRLEPERADYQFLLARAHHADDPADARGLAALDAALERQPARAEFLLFRAVALAARGATREAADAFARAASVGGDPQAARAALADLVGHAATAAEPAPLYAAYLDAFATERQSPAPLEALCAGGFAGRLERPVVLGLLRHSEELGDRVFAAAAQSVLCALDDRRARLCHQR